METEPSDSQLGYPEFKYPSAKTRRALRRSILLGTKQYLCKDEMNKEIHQKLTGKDVLMLYRQLRELRHSDSLIKVVAASNPSDPKDSIWQCSLSPYFDYPSLVATSGSSAADAYDMLMGFILLDHLGLMTEADIQPGTSEMIIPCSFDDFPVSSIAGPDILAALQEEPPISPTPQPASDLPTPASA